MNDLYMTDWTLLFNYFVPSMKLKSKTRSGTKVIKLHDAAKTPFVRLCESGALTKNREREMARIFQSINPFALQARFKRKILAILKCASVNPAEEESE